MTCPCANNETTGLCDLEVPCWLAGLSSSAGLGVRDLGSHHQADLAPPDTDVAGQQRMMEAPVRTQQIAEVDALPTLVRHAQVLPGALQRCSRRLLHSLG